MDPVIRCEDLWKIYEIGDQRIDAVAGVDLVVAAGEFLTLLGHSGSGKSTLLSMIGGLTRPSAGRVLIAGTDIWQQDDGGRAGHRNRTFGFIFQFASLIPTLPAIENVVLPRLFGAGRPSAEAYAEAASLLERVGLGAKLEAFPGELSGGQQRRVAIARALINRPKILLADEPTGDLDEDSEAEVMDLLLGTCRDVGTCVLLVTHNRDLALRTDRVVKMKNGSMA